MPKIKISEYLLNKQGVRLKDLPAGLTEEEYNKAVVEAMRTCIPQLADNFILTDDDDVDSMIAKLQLLEENPSIDSNSVYHTKFKVFMNRYTYDYANCPAAPKKITMQIRDTSKFLYDNKYADNRIGVYKLVATMGRRPTSYNVTYTYYSVNADGPIDGTFKTSTDATLVWEPLNRRFEITIGTSTNAKFLQDTEYDVYIDWCGSNFINFEEPAYAFDAIGSNLPDLDTLIKYDSIYEHAGVNCWAQKYSDDLIAYYDKTSNTSILTDTPGAFFNESGVYIFNGANKLIISNYNDATDSSASPHLLIYNVNELILINCHTDEVGISSCKNVSLIDCGFVNDSDNVNMGSHVKLSIINCDNVKLSNCRHIASELYSTADNLIEFTDVNNLTINKSNFEFSYRADSQPSEYTELITAGVASSILLVDSVFATNSDMCDYYIDAPNTMVKNLVVLYSNEAFVFEDESISAASLLKGAQN